MVDHFPVPLDLHLQATLLKICSSNGCELLSGLQLHKHRKSGERSPCIVGFNDLPIPSLDPLRRDKVVYCVFKTKSESLSLTLGECDPTARFCTWNAISLGNLGRVQLTLTSSPPLHTLQAASASFAGHLNCCDRNSKLLLLAVREDDTAAAKTTQH